MKNLLIVLLLAAPAAASEFDRTRPVPLEAPRPFILPRIERTTLSNGLQLAVMELRRLPLAAVEILLPFAGSALDPEGQSGLARLVASMLDEGTATRSGEDLADEVEGLGRVIVAAEKDIRDREFLRVSLFVAKREEEEKSLLDKLDGILGMAADMLRNPVFPDPALERVRRDVLEGIRQAKVNPEKLADQRLAAKVFGAHPYGRRPDEAAIGALSRQDLLDFHASRFVPSGSVISVSGNVAVDEAKRLVEKHFGSWAAAPAAALARLPEAVPAGPAKGGLAIELTDFPGLRQSSVRLGHASIPRDHPDYFPVIIMNTVLGRNPITSRIGRNIREEKGWTYDAKSSVLALRNGGLFEAHTEVQFGRTADAVVEILREIKTLQDEPLGQEELDEFKQFAAGMFVRGHVDAQSLAAATGLNDLLGLSPDTLAVYKDKLLAVTAEQVQAAAKKYLHPDAIHIVVVGDADKVYDGLAKIAPVEVLDRDGKPKPVRAQPRG